MPKNNMKNTAYYKSGRHKDNALKARQLAVAAQQTILENKITEYLNNPNKCSCCLIPLSYTNKTNKFCSTSCSATYNNRKRDIPSEKSRTKTSVSLKKFFADNQNTYTRKYFEKNFCVVSFHPCKICNKLITFRSKKPTRKTCSRECQIHASVGIRPYTNARRLNIYYFNRFENKTVLLESSWELSIAKWLDDNQIDWIRPKPIIWYDEQTKKTRLYYPDFYIPKLHLYLDPKNPTAIAKSIYKMSVVSKLINLVYGNVQDIKDTIYKLYNS
jgi:hypothetical protein